MSSVIEIIKQHLVDNGFDGLVNGDAECGCELSDLQPCGESFADCKSAYKYPDPTGESNFLMFEEKQEESKDDKNA
ncbi:hypothetical protein Nit79A3_1377 [Nitrosomonas sp. Is79A3]|uniref:hypothetical protein n=1 Tax=Nitrosomonas sp. (strain Is79A3) TaxID=261292 RepID=UPI000215CEED